MKRETRSYTFDSLAAFYQAATGSSRWERPAGWLGATEQEIQDRRFSWPAGVEKLEQLPEMHIHAARTKRARRWSMDDGDDMHMERFLDGRPFMRQRYKANTGPKHAGRIQRIRINTGESAEVSAHAMLWKTYAAARLVDILERQGTRCEVLSCCSARQSFDYGARNYALQITVKRPEQPLNLAAITATTAPWFLRWHILNHIQTHHDARPGSGKPRKLPEDPAALDIETGECLCKAAAERWILEAQERIAAAI